MGSGGKKLPGYVNVDSNPEEHPDVVCNLSWECWPWADDSVDAVAAFHVLEHVGPLPDDLFWFLKELYRVCKPGARVDVIVPHPRHDVFLNDPTHVRPVTPDLMALFSKRIVTESAAAGKIYTPFYKYVGVDFDLPGPVQYVLDPSIDPKVDDWRAMERRMNNVVIEYRFHMVAVK